jgi:hypothetical protein
MLPGFICSHVAEGERPALYVEHDVPLDDAPRMTGWSVSCGAGPHPDSEIKIVNLDRYMDADPALAELRATLPEGSMAYRSAAGQPWVVEPIPQDEAA